MADKVNTVRYRMRLAGIAFAAVTLMALGQLRCASSPPPPPPKPPVPFGGERALHDTADLVALGPRPSGSDALRRAQNLIIERLKAAGLVVRQDGFVAATPAGDIPMKNVIGVLEGKRPGVIMIATHYDTKRMDKIRFVGANDGGAGSGALLELARTMAARGKPKYTYWFVFFDGEESVGKWTEEDSLYGSRHLVDTLRAQKLLGNVRAMILLDLVGDADLTILKETNSYATYRDLFWDKAKALGYGRYFRPEFVTVDDDHLPFAQAGIRSVDLIDFMYGGRKVPGKYWHTAEDTMDKISAKSLQIVGDVVLATLPAIERLTYVIETRTGFAPPTEPGEASAEEVSPASEGDVVGGVLAAPESQVPTTPKLVGPPLAP
jgi:glutaminyl-peptide cyclotransferase